MRATIYKISKNEKNLNKQESGQFEYTSLCIPLVYVQNTRLRDAHAMRFPQKSVNEE